MGFFAAIAAGFGAGHLGLTLLGGQQGATAVIVTSAPDVTNTPEPKSTADTPWPAVFGTYEPDAPAPAAPEPVVTVVNHNYTLKGLFASSANSWAIVSDPGGEYLLRTGDELPGGALVDEITEEGVWLETAQGRELIAFGE